SKLRPAQLIFVDDASTPENFALLEQEVARIHDLPTQIIRNPRNLGLAASRNAGLACVETEFVCVHDNDNLILNSFLSDSCAMLARDPSLAAVSSWMQTFDDGVVWRQASAHPRA